MENGTASPQVLLPPRQAMLMASPLSRQLTIECDPHDLDKITGVAAGKVTGIHTRISQHVFAWLILPCIGMQRPQPITTAVSSHYPTSSVDPMLCKCDTALVLRRFPCGLCMGCLEHETKAHFICTYPRLQLALQPDFETPPTSMLPLAYKTWRTGNHHMTQSANSPLIRLSGPEPYWSKAVNGLSGGREFDTHTHHEPGVGFDADLSTVHSRQALCASQVIEARDHELDPRRPPTGNRRVQGILQIKVGVRLNARHQYGIATEW